MKSAMILAALCAALTACGGGGGGEGEPYEPTPFEESQRQRELERASAICWGNSGGGLDMESFQYNYETRWWSARCRNGQVIGARGPRPWDDGVPDEPDEKPAR
jgi:predicted small lipoprotein YifL